QYEFELPNIDFQPKNIVFAGMGGSALAASLSTTWPGYSVPFEICRDYDIPSYVSEKTLFIASSYSGNTEETLSSIKQAAECGACVVVITSGGKLAEIAKEHGYPVALLPGGLQPRHAVLYSFKALVTILDACRLLGDKNIGMLDDAVELI